MTKTPRQWKQAPRYEGVPLRPTLGHAQIGGRRTGNCLPGSARRPGPAAGSAPAPPAAVSAPNSNNSVAVQPWTPTRWLSHNQVSSHAHQPCAHSPLGPVLTASANEAVQGVTHRVGQGRHRAEYPAVICAHLPSGHCCRTCHLLDAAAEGREGANIRGSTAKETIVARGDTCGGLQVHVASLCAKPAPYNGNGGRALHVQIQQPTLAAGSAPVVCQDAFLLISDLNLI
jgi:hypothetical protein